MARFEELRDPLATILQEDVNCYWLAYQILHKLRERYPEILQRLEGQYGTGYGVGGGAHFRPDSAIAACLLDWHEHIDVRYLRGNNVQVGDTRATGERMGIYCWIGPAL